MNKIFEQVTYNNKLNFFNFDITSKMEMFKDLSKHSDTPTELVKLPIVFILDIL